MGGKVDPSQNQEGRRLIDLIEDRSEEEWLLDVTCGMCAARGRKRAGVLGKTVHARALCQAAHPPVPSEQSPELNSAPRSKPGVPSDGRVRKDHQNFGAH